MKQCYGPIGATIGGIASVIDHGFYGERGRRLRVEPLLGDVRGFAYRMLTQLTAGPGSLSLRLRYV